MKKTIVGLACMLAVGLGSVDAHATDLLVNDDYYLGSIVPGLPSGDGNEESFIAALIAMSPTQPSTLTPCGDDAKTPNTCTRSDNVFGTLPAPSIFDKEDPTDGTVDVTGFSYILAKYGKGGDTNQISHVWYVGGLESATIETAALSHISRFNSTSVPDGGTTLMLLGGALVGIGALRRKVGF